MNPQRSSREVEGSGIFRLSSVREPDGVPIILRRSGAAVDSGVKSQLGPKRSLDVTFSFVLILLCLPLFLVCFVAVRLSSSGPFIFSQPRWGYGGCHFACYKMRTMHAGSDKDLGFHQAGNGGRSGTLAKSRRDARVTRVGKFLRRTSLDELPQLFNVLKGDMSLVGPRPLMIHMMSDHPEIRARRSVVRPGLTGLWQIRNRANNTSVLDMIEDDVEYIATYSLWLDVRILLRTPLVVLLGSGAY